tara:strand:+ start:449 stop:2191 length:1743 start_codon:yes stop_codon:yes gene_type:complete
MPINFFASVNLDKQEIQQVSIEKLSSNPGSGVDSYKGRIIYTQDTNTLKYYDGSNWINLTGAGGVASVSASATTSTSSTGAPLVINPPTAAVVIESREYDGFGNVGHVPAGGTATEFLRGDGNWVVINPSGGTMSSWSLDASVGGAGPQTVSDTSLVEFINGTDITANILSSLQIQLDHNAITRTDTSVPQTPASGGTFTAVDSVTTSAQGHVTAINLSTVTLPAETASDYTLSTAAITGGATTTLNLSGSTTGTSIRILGTASEVEVTSTGATTGVYLIGLPNNVTIGGTLTVTTSIVNNGTLTVSGASTLNGALVVNSTGAFTGQVTIPSVPANATDAASKAYVDNLIVGGLVFKGSYDAANNSPVLDGSSNIASTQGDTYVVTQAGDFYTEAVEVGDVLIARVNVTAGSGALTDWVTVQNNIGLASNTVQGIANFPTANGFAGSMTAGSPALAPHTSYTTEGSASSVPVISTNAFGVVTAITDTPIAITASDVTDFETEVDALIGDATWRLATDIGGSTSVIVTHNMGTRDIIVQLYDNSTYETIFAEVDRNSTSQVTITFSTAPAANGVRCLITKI